MRARGLSFYRLQVVIMHIARDILGSPPADSQAGAIDVGQCFDDQFQSLRDDVYQFIERRMSPTLRRRVDPSDVFQETHLAAASRYAAFSAETDMPFRVWLLKTAQQKLVDCYRTHLGAAKRTLKRETQWRDNSSICLANHLLQTGSSPSARLQAEETRQQVEQSLRELPDTDREILLMRHIENRPYDEIAALLDLQPANVRQRCGRALLRLRKIMSQYGLLDG